MTTNYLMLSSGPLITNDRYWLFSALHDIVIIESSGRRLKFVYFETVDLGLAFKQITCA